MVDIIQSSIPTNWKHVFDKAKNELDDIYQVLRKEEIFYPYPNEVYKALDLVNPSEVKVVIIGQDPYPGVNPDGTPEACGLAFSARPNAPIPKSLHNIFIELNKEYNCPIPDNGDLTPWAKQGVLLLNMSLTVRPYKPKSHGGIWLGLIYRILLEISKYNPVFMLWGRDAARVENMLKYSGIFLRSAHPSPLSATRFFGCNHFKLANEILVKNGKQPIDWKL